MKAIIKKPGKPPEVVEMSTDLKSLQGIVGGYIEALPSGDKSAIVYCDEEGLLKELTPNVEFGGRVLVGTIVVCGYKAKGAKTVPLTDEQVKRWTNELTKSAV